MRISDWSSDVCSSDLGHNHSTVPLLALQAPRLGGVRGYLAPSSRVSTTGLRPNNAFKPKPLRSANHMAGKDCHVLRSTARLGLTSVLGLLKTRFGTGVVLRNATCSLCCLASVGYALRSETRSVGTVWVMTVSS